MRRAFKRFGLCGSAPRVMLSGALSFAVLVGLVSIALSLLPSEAHAQRFRRPVACTSCIANWFYFDHGGRQDWSCASSTYGGHSGSDFSLLGGNGAINDGHDVVAVAGGVVEQALDGNADHCTACGGAGCGRDFGFGYGNYLVINHGSHKTIYAHLRRNSLRVAVGDSVTCGEVIGQIASSGCSTGAHLHFETRPLGGRSGTAYDPFKGDCSTRPSSLWVTQGSHRGMPGPMCEDGSGPMDPEPCPSGWYDIWTCNGDGRRRCIDGNRQTETCEHGCESMPVGTDDVCACPDGWFELFNCHGDNQRRKCVDGETSVETCEHGCEVQALGENDTCNPPPVMSECPEGLGSAWTCNGETERQRCVDGVTTTEGCPQGCVGMESGDDECGSVEIPDNDGDGATADIDCDDWDDARYPGAPETCGDSVDSNCDGEDCGSEVDAGTDGGSGDGGSGDGGFDSGFDGGGFDGGASDTDPVDGGDDLEGECSCRVGSDSSVPASKLLFAGVLGLVFLRRRR